MKQLSIRLALLTALLACAVMALSACGSQTNSPPEDPAISAEDSAQSPQAGKTDAKPSLEDLMGADYQAYIVETITMQMENRMDPEPEVEFFPIRDDKPLTDYVAIDDTLTYTVEENGDVTIVLPAGSVADEAHGDQSFSIPNPHPETDQ